MNAEFLRYSCQMALPGFSESAQHILQNARVLVVGVGGLGCPAAQYLAAAGVGILGLADFDVVSVSNLHRQILFTPTDAGKKKVEVARERLQQQNPDVNLIPHDILVTSDNVMELVEQYDVIVDGTDNFESRYLLNDAGVISGKPVVYGAIYQFEGQVAFWNLKNQNGTRSPNYRDLFPDVNAAQIPNCADGGVIPTLAGIIGSMQANEVIKYITNTGELLAGKVLIFDAQTLQSRIIKIGEVTKKQVSRLKQTIVVPTISVAELKNALAENSINLIDVRTEEEREAFHIGGEHVPMGLIADRLKNFDNEQKTVIYCSSGKRSADAIKIIKQQFPNADLFSLEGGITEWMALNA